MTVKENNKLIRQSFFKLLDNYIATLKSNHPIYIYYQKEYGMPYSFYNYKRDKVFVFFDDDYLYEEYFEKINPNLFIDALDEEDHKQRFINCYNEIINSFNSENSIELNTVANGFNIPHQASINNYNRTTLTVNVYKAFFFSYEELIDVFDFYKMSFKKDSLKNNNFISIQELSNLIHENYKNEDLIKILHLKKTESTISKEENLKKFLENISIENEADLELITRTLREQNIINRDRTIVNRLKFHYNNTCQIKSCNKQITLISGEKYSEVHHLHPLGKDGYDVAENMIVVCPNCHVELDFGKAISKDDIYIKEPHFIKNDYLEFQNNKQAIKN